MTTPKVQKIIEDLGKRLGHPSGINGTLKFDFGDQGSALIDPTADPTVTDGEGKKAACTISMSIADFEKLKTGELDGTSAFMQGRLRVAGDMGLALKLGPLLQKAHS